MPLYRPYYRKSNYIGTDVMYENIGEIKADVQFVSDAALCELYGVKIARSVMFFCERGTVIHEKYRFDYRGETYEVKGVSEFKNTLKGVAEKI